MMNRKKFECCVPFNFARHLNRNVSRLCVLSDRVGGCGVGAGEDSFRIIHYGIPFKRITFLAYRLSKSGNGGKSLSLSHLFYLLGMVNTANWVKSK